MAQRTDLYSILVSYANKNNSPYIEIDPFLDFLVRYAKKASDEHPEWNKWVQDGRAKFWSEMSVLVEEDKCKLLTDTANGRIYMPQFYLELLEEAYRKPDEDADLPFPGEESLRISLPENQTKSINADYGLIHYLEEPQDSKLPILKLNFPEGFGSVLVLAGMIPRLLTEMSILKIRNYLRRHGYKEYAFRKLSPQLQGKDSGLQDQLTRILIRPLDCYSAIIAGGEFSYLFWAHFCILLKDEIKEKNEFLSDDIAAMQSVLIIEAVNGYYKSLAVKRKDVELGLKSLENRLTKAPYLYTLGEIFRFTGSKGLPLLRQYSSEDLEEWLRKKTTESKNNELPELLIFHGSNGEQKFLLKDKTIALCLRLLNEARVLVRDAVSKHWRRMLLEYQTEPAMEDDGEFEKMLLKFTEKLCPELTALFEDPKLFLVNEEQERNQAGQTHSARIFNNNGQLLPYSALFFMNRREMLLDAKLILPFWYSLPVITAIIALFKNMTRKKESVKLAASGNSGGEKSITDEKDPAAEIRSAAAELEFIMIPPGHSMDSYLEELEGRWSRLIHKQARENLIEDVRSLIRDQLRQNLKVMKQFRVTGEIISQMASNIVNRTPALASLSGKDSLILYTELYLLKLLENAK